MLSASTSFRTLREGLLNEIDLEITGKQAGSYVGTRDEETHENHGTA